MGHHADLLHAPCRDVRPVPAVRHVPPVCPGRVDAARAVLAVALIALAPDGRTDAATLARLGAVLSGGPTLSGLTPAAFDELAFLTLRGLAARGPDRVLADLRGLMPRDLAESALALAVRASMVAGRLPPERAGILGGLANRLDIPVAVLADMIAVIAMLERPLS